MTQLRTAQEIKNLKSRLEKKQAELKEVDFEAQGIVKTKDKLQAELKYLESQIQNLKNTNSEPIVTEHALLRYLERVKGVNLEAIAQEILTEPIVHTIKTIEKGRIKTPDYKIVFRDRCVITVVA